MAGRGPVVNITVTGDATSAKRAFKDTGDAADHMAADIDQASDKTRRSLDDIDGAAGNTERGFRGLNDGIGGTTAVLGTFGVTAGGTVGQVGGLIQGFTDLAGFVGDFAVQIPPLLVKMGLLTAATEGQTGAQYALNTAFLANPITLVVLALIALAAAFYLAWTKSETFREVVTGVFDAVKDAAMAAYNWIKDNWPLLLTILTGPFGAIVWVVARNWNAIVEFIGGIPGRIGAIMDTLGRTMAKPFEYAYDVAKWAWENIYDGFAWLGNAIWGAISPIAGLFDSIISKVRWLIDHIPRIPRPPGWVTPGGGGGFFGSGIGPGGGIPGLASGGIVSGPTIAMIGEAGPEAVVPLNRMSGLSGGVTVNVSAGVGDPAAIGREVVKAIQAYERSSGSTWRR